jgi:hypothetical protein
MKNTVEFFATALSIVGLSGSYLNEKEKLCLQSVFNAEPIIFPSLVQVEGDKK